MLQVLNEPPATATRGTVRVYNPTGHDVTTVITTVLPLAQGAYRGGAIWRATGATAVPEHVVHEKMGAGWRDGTEKTVEMRGYTQSTATIPGAEGESWRYARIHFRCDIPANSDKVVTIEQAQASIPTFTLHADVLAALNLGLPWFRLYVGSDFVDLFDQPGLVTEASGLVQVVRFRGRAPNTPFWAELYVQFHTAMRHARFWFWYGHSWIDDPLRTAPEYTLPGHVELFTRGASVYLRHESIKQMSKTPVGIDTTVRLIDSTEAGGNFHDGCAQAITGVLQFGVEPLSSDLSADAQTWRAMQTQDPLAVATTWRSTRAFGPFGWVVERPPWIADDAAFRALAVARAQRDYADGVISGGGPWAMAQYGCNPNPGDSGPQPDFGVVRHVGIAASAHPAGLRAAQRSAYQEACRPVFFRFADVTPWDIVTRPTFLWGERPHAPGGADMLGKDRRLIDVSRLPHPRNSDRMRWSGHDHEHYTFNHLTFYALLTGDLLAREICHYRAELWRGIKTYVGSPGSPGSSRNNADGAARARGRTLHAGCQVALVTGRDDLWVHVRERTLLVELNQWAGNGNTHEWIGFSVRDPQLGPLRLEHYRSWEELQGVVGYAAGYALFGIANLRAHGLRVAKSMLLNAFQDRRATSPWQRYRLWPNASWSAPGTPPNGTVVTCGAGTGRIAYQYITSSYDSYVQLYECTGTWGNGAPIVAATGAQLDWSADIRYRYDLTEMAPQGASRNGDVFHTDAQRIEIDPLRPPNVEQPLLHFAWGGITVVWSLAGVLLARQWAQQLGDGTAEAAAQAVLDNWLPARGAPGDGYLDEGEGAWSQWAGVVDDPWV